MTAPIVIDGQAPRHTAAEPALELTFRDILTGVAVAEVSIDAWLEEARLQARAWGPTVPAELLP